LPAAIDPESQSFTTSI